MVDILLLYSPIATAIAAMIILSIQIHPCAKTLPNHHRSLEISSSSSKESEENLCHHSAEIFVSCMGNNNKLCNPAVLLLSLYLCLITGSSSSTRVELGSILKPPEQWKSSEGTFGFGFYRNKDATDSYVVGISFSNINDTDLVWAAAGLSVVDANSSIKFDSDGNLVLRDGYGKMLWQTGTSGEDVGFALLQENGNFVLKDSAKNATVWESFANPTNTLLVGQNLSAGKSLSNDPYSLSFNSVGNLTLQWKENITYWNAAPSSNGSKDYTASLSSDGIFAIHNASGGQLWIARSSDYSDNATSLRKLKLDSDGNLRSYSWQESSNSWYIEWNAVQDQCLVYGWCGNFGICVYNDTGPTCTCPSANFSPVKPDDPMQGCKRKDGIDIGECSNNQSMVELDHTLLLSYPPETDDFFGGVTDCQQNCLKTQSCIAATVLNDGTGKCRFKSSNFTSGYQSMTIPSTSYIKVCGEALFSSTSETRGASSQTRTKISVIGVVLAILGTLFFLVLIESGFWWVCCRNNPRFGAWKAQYTLLEYASGAPIQFSYKDLKQATRNFKEKVGSGGFGTVYKGILPNRSLVAVKKLEGIAQGDKQFRMEVATISSTHHLHLVRLIGFCSEGRHRLLVYEFMKNTSLDTFIFASPEQSRKLNWETRLNIALGTARGIAYLHEECRDCIIHCDIKPENILLDDNLNAKVSDFGLAKLNNARDIRNYTLNSVHGTRGYLAPEWLANLPVTSKSDVFSYGMVLLETVSGKRNFDVCASLGKKKFSTWAYEEFEKGNLFNILDKNLGEDVNFEEVERTLKVSFWCIQEQPSQRPSMGKVVKMLEGVLPVDKPPSPKSFESLQSSASINASVSASGSMTSMFAASAPPVSSSSSADVFISLVPGIVEASASLGTVISADNNLSS